MKVVVTQEMIDSGQAYSPDLCPIALALQAVAGPNARAGLGGWWMKPEGAGSNYQFERRTLPPEALTFMHKIQAQGRPLGLPHPPFTRIRR